MCHSTKLFCCSEARKTYLRLTDSEERLSMKKYSHKTQLNYTHEEKELYCTKLWNHGQHNSGIHKVAAFQ